MCRLLPHRTAAFWASVLVAIDGRLLREAQGLTLQQGPPAAAPPGLATTPADAAAASAQPAPLPEADAVTMNTWVFLKEAMGKLRGEVQQVMLVKDDMAEMKEDLKDQVKMWQKAETDMNAENAKMQSDLEALRKKVAENPVQKEVDALKNVLAQEKQKTSQLTAKLNSDEAGRDLTRSFWRERAQNLTAEIQHINATDQAEIGKQHELQLQLQTDTVALRLKSSELQDRLKSGMGAYQMQQRQANIKKAELERELNGMRQALARLQTQLGQTSRESQQKNLAKAQADVDRMTAEMVQLAQTQSSVAQKCQQEKTQRYEIACAERDKTQKRQEETRQLCQPVNGQMSALQQLLSECQAKTSATAPTGMDPNMPAY